MDFYGAVHKRSSPKNSVASCILSSVSVRLMLPVLLWNTVMCIQVTDGPVLYCDNHIVQVKCFLIWVMISTETLLCENVVSIDN